MTRNYFGYNVYLQIIVIWISFEKSHQTELNTFIFYDYLETILAKKEIVENLKGNFYIATFYGLNDGYN